MKMRNQNGGDIPSPRHANRAFVEGTSHPPP